MVVRDPGAPGTPHTIKALRLALGLSMRDLEARSGVSRAVISNMERGMLPTAAQARAIAEALATAARESERRYG